MPCVKVGISMKRRAVKKKRKTRSLDVQNVEMCLQVRTKEDPSSELDSQFVNMRESGESQSLAPSFIHQSFHQCCEGFSQLGPKLTSNTIMQCLTMSRQTLAWALCFTDYSQSLQYIAVQQSTVYIFFRNSVLPFSITDLTYKPVRGSVTEGHILYNTFLYIPSIFFKSFYKYNSTTSSSTGGF